MQTDAEVAAKLTKAQVRCLMLIPMGSERRAVSFSGSVASRLCQPAMNRPALLAATLTNLGRTAWYRHTADGLRVAQHLKQENAKS